MSASRSEPGVESLFVWMLLVGSHAVGEAVTPEGFNRLEAAVDGTDGWAACPLCGDWVRAHGLAGHQAASPRCRWLTAHRAVEDGWAEGWRDPWSQRPASFVDRRVHLLAGDVGSVIPGVLAADARLFHPVDDQTIALLTNNIRRDGS